MTMTETGDAGEPNRLARRTARAKGRVTRVHRTIAIRYELDVKVDALAETQGAHRSGIATVALERYVEATVPSLPPDARARFEATRRRLEEERLGPTVASTTPAQPAEGAAA
jgi:hypothetical protein